jgi:hypothetical protein
MKERKVLMQELPIANHRNRIDILVDYICGILPNWTKWLRCSILSGLLSELLKKKRRLKKIIS